MLVTIVCRHSRSSTARPRDSSRRSPASAQRDRHRARAAAHAAADLPGADQRARPDSVVEQKAGAYRGSRSSAIAITLRRVSRRCARRAIAERDAPSVDRDRRGSGVRARFLESASDARSRPSLHVARLARLELTDDEVERMAAELSQGARPHREDPRARPRRRAADLARRRCRQRAAGRRARAVAAASRSRSQPAPEPSRAASASRARARPE